MVRDEEVKEEEGGVQRDKGVFYLSTGSMMGRGADRCGAISRKWECPGEPPSPSGSDTTEQIQ